MTPRRVLMTADSIGGVFSYSLDLARGLSLLGIEVWLAVMGGRLDRSQRAAADAIDGLHVEDTDFALEWMEEPWGDVAAAGAWLTLLAKRVEPDVVHLNGYAHGSLPFGRPLVMVGHSCVSSWYEAVKGEPPPPRFDRYRAAVKDGLRAADCVVAPSRFMADALERWYGPLPAVRVVPNGVWPGDHPAGPKERSILAAGRLWDEANPIAQLTGIAMDLPWPVQVAGDPAFGTARARVPAGVEPLGRLSRMEMASRMARAGIFVHMVRYEPFGLTPLEAAAAGCALVLSDIETFRDLWGDAALLVPLDDPAALRDALRTLCRDDGARRQAAERASARAHDFHAQVTAAAMCRIYQEVTAQGAGRRKAG